METTLQTTQKKEKEIIPRRVVVTGMGMITPLGNDLDTTWNSLLAGKNAVKRVTHFDVTKYRSEMAAEINEFDPSSFLAPKEIKHIDLFTQYAISAGLDAARDAGLDLAGDDKTAKRAGIFIGSGIGGGDTIQKQHISLLQRSPRAVTPHFVPMILVNMAASQLSIRLNLRGPILAISTACASSAHAIGEAYHKIKYGYADIMLGGGAEASINPLPYAGFCAARSMSTRNDSPETASRPFDKDRDGFVMGEGAGVVVLEGLEHALDRKARIYAELIGYGSTADAYHVVAPDPDFKGALSAMKESIQDASCGVCLGEIDYINAHGTSTPFNDKFETLAIKELLGEDSYKTAINSTKSMIGHLLGASGAVEFIVTVMSITQGKIHPTINLFNPDPECDLDYVPGKFREKNIRLALTNSFGFGGVNASLLLSRFTP